MITKQEGFDKVWQHFIVEKSSPSVGVFGNCMYAKTKNTRCAIGLFLESKDCKRLDDEETSLLPALQMYPSIFEKFEDIFVEDENENFWIKLQIAHDSTANHFIIDDFYPELKLKLIKLAQNFNLKLPTTV